MGSALLSNDLFLRACRRERLDRPPIWIMRQAGRYMPEYQEIRKKTTFLGLCKTPELAAQATLLPIDLLGLDAAILFSDILIPVEAMGLDLEFTEHKGPRFSNPVRTDADIDRLVVPEARKATGFVADAVRLINKRLDGRVPLLGFSGSPFTLATYMVEGEIERGFRRRFPDRLSAPHVIKPSWPPQEGPRPGSLPGEDRPPRSPTPSGKSQRRG